MKNAIPVRMRGPQPSSLEPLMRSERWRNEASGFIGICSTLGALPPTPVKNPKKELPTLARGEQLCHAYEIYRSMAPGQCLDFDRALLVFSAVAEGTEIKAVNRRPRLTSYRRPTLTRGSGGFGVRIQGFV